MEKPDYVKNFARPANTEIKFIKGHWYLYERHSVYDPQLGRSRKISGKILGSITEQGLIPSRARREWVNPVLNDVVEVGAVNYIYQKTAWMRCRLQKYFPDIWQYIYTVAIIRAAYDCRFRRMQLHYEDSILSYIYPDLSFMPGSVTEFLNTLGRMRGAIRGYMQEMVAEHERFLLFDGHRLLSASHTVDNAECGYDSRMRYKPQINLLYMFTLGEDIEYPVYYKQYLGSTLDVSAFSDILKESTAYADNCTVIADKGFASDDDFSLLEECGLKYVIPLKRGNRFVKGHVPASPFGYEEAFSFNGRGIHSLTLPEEGFHIHLFLDTDLLSQEIADATKRTEKQNATIKRKKEQELKRRNKGKGRLTDEELEALEPLTVKEAYADKEEMGTITLKTNRTELNAFQVYSIYKQRQAIEQFFKTYGDTMSYEASYMRNNYTEEAWLFLNHLSSIIGVNAIEEIASIGESKNISYKDLAQTLIKIKAGKADGKWTVYPVKKSVQKLCEKMQLNPYDLTGLGL